MFTLQLVCHQTDLFGVESILGIGSIYNIIKYTDNESLYELAKSEERRQVDFALSLVSW